MKKSLSVMLCMFFLMGFVVVSAQYSSAETINNAVPLAVQDNTGENIGPVDLLAAQAGYLDFGDACPGLQSSLCRCCGSGIGPTTCRECFEIFLENPSARTGSGNLGEVDASFPCLRAN